MKNFRHEGNMVPCTAPEGGVVSGVGVKIGDLFGVPATSAAEGEPFELAVAGVFTLPKAAVAVAECVKVYWASGAGNVTTTASGNTLIGHSVGAYADTVTEMDVRLGN
ncbi:DUF2190 family protein [Afifella sp. YEN Y35]|uniref:DUF2190 family protein n=1 Tax=Afifella sp. YEN Y35 TaxID=3388337 RepID=UPI0039E0527C